MTAAKPAGLLTDDVRRIVTEQRLGFVATVCPDGTPNLSPKGTVAVWDDRHLLFADLRSPRTVRNLRNNPAIEVNVVDPVARSGYRFKGEASVVTSGPLFERAVRFFARDGVRLDARLLALVKLRTSQLNGCAYCTDMHSKDARALGEDEQRLHLLVAWREAPGFSAEERAALAWAEALTLLAQLGVPDDRYQELARRFAPEQVVGLTLAVIATNGWNRLCRAFQFPAGGYVPPDSLGAVGWPPEPA